MRITNLKAQKNKKRVNVYLDGKFAFGLDADNLVKAGLKIGQELSEKEVEKLVFKNEFQKFYDRTLRLIAARPRSEKEIRDYLKRKKALPSLIEKVIKKLIAVKQINDLEFAKWWLEQRSVFRPRGKIALKLELRQKGIDQKLAEKLITKNVDELKLAKKAAQKKLKAFKNLEPLEFRKKMTGFLSRRGFSWETIKKTLENLDQKG